MSSSDADPPRPEDLLAPRRVHPDSPLATRRPVLLALAGLAALVAGIVVAANLFGTFGQPRGGWSVLVPQTAVPVAMTPSPEPTAEPEDAGKTPEASPSEAPIAVTPTPRAAATGVRPTTTKRPVRPRPVAPASSVTPPQQPPSLPPPEPPYVPPSPAPPPPSVPGGDPSTTPAG